jgi:molybdopterin synthase sulfur carrier subunit
VSSEITVRFWAGARRAAGHAEEQLHADTIGALRAELAARPKLAALSEVVSFLVDGVQAGDTARLSPGAEVDVLPPFAGG